MQSPTWSPNFQRERENKKKKLHFPSHVRSCLGSYFQHYVDRSFESFGCISSCSGRGFLPAWIVALKGTSGSRLTCNSANMQQQCQDYNKTDAAHVAYNSSIFQISNLYSSSVNIHFRMTSHQNATNRFLKFLEFTISLPNSRRTEKTPPQRPPTWR